MPLDNNQVATTVGALARVAARTGREPPATTRSNRDHLVRKAGR